ncbi:type II toxin-antitoxin system mRNA interferase toxin, RelE/StbE family [Candidatus Roizmanbacteria bacterium CG_4_10_14_0_2_um_filter_36_9]|uniref:Type II toxin-antitoxin system mRNA interferase toxin, RelE/StbE family n=1 Tax=Candidatus Roizmanbacteria bacterium CG_4_10_14_0_2_um_filter_36_9 TaxID=1974823 RepID=A0A2M7U2L6_9BACT|nr:MAG: type II toxin-antitoxin system mRNA interferase toxin, RelE/StbE family [Candidatus Roizmanbacteria bacterium CG_4_10_14_0_2_um_filter_36_9]
MMVNNALYARSFLKEAKKLPADILNVFEKKEKIFRLNPLHPSLRLHKLHGELDFLWSISLNKNYRAIFKRQKNGDILFVSIGKHDIYDAL